MKLSLSGLSKAFERSVLTSALHDYLSILRTGAAAITPVHRLSWDVMSTHLMLYKDDDKYFFFSFLSSQANFP